ncbi:MAG: hypothetical protein M0038_19930, partial [Pseudomonadota bacterium]|nr:hypothetical protein [Pseudomonadota bacterium]
IGAGEFELPQRELRAQLDSGQYRLAVEVADTSGAVELAWEVEGPAEFDEALKALTDAGARPEVRGDLLDERGVEGLARFQDPNEARRRPHSVDRE